MVGQAYVFTWGDVWVLEHLEIEKLYRNKGVATAILHRIIEDAKNFNRRLELQCHKKLVKFYKKLGFYIRDYPDDERYPVLVFGEK